MDNKEYKNSEEVKKRAEEAIGRPFKEISREKWFKREAWERRYRTGIRRRVV